MTRILCALGVLGGCFSLYAQQPPAQTPQTTFRAAVEVTTLDVSVVDDRGKPIENLTPADFTIRVEGNVRKVITAEWVSLNTGDSKEGPPLPEGYSSNQSSMGGRLIVLAIDEPNIRFGGTMAIVKATNAFLDRLLPGDRVAVAGFGKGSPATVFTADRERVKRTIARMMGQKQVSSARLMGANVGFAEAQAIVKGDRLTLEQVWDRECARLERDPLALAECRMRVEMTATMTARDADIEANETLNNMRDLLIGLSRINAPKTMVLISEGFPMNDEATIIDIGTMAAQARTSVYALQLDTPLFDITDGRMPVSPFQDRQARTEGLDLLAAAARGTLFTVTGTGEPLFERIVSEISGYYVLGVESDPRDHDGKSHAVRVEVSRRGAVVRSRRQVLNAKADRTAPQTARQAATAALNSPLLSAALPVRVTSFSLQGPEQGRVQVLIHADIGTDYAASRAMAVSYVIYDKEGKQIDAQSDVKRLPPVLNGVPAALPYTAGASLAPGDYTLKLAAADGDRVGSVEHPIHAGLSTAADMSFSELMVGGPAEAGELLKPTIGYQVTFGTVHGYLEAYGSKAASLTMEYEIANDPSAPALFNVDVPAREAGVNRAIFTRVMPVHQLPPGRYVLRAILSDGNRAIKTLTRPFEVAPPKVLMTSADGLGATSVDSELFLPVDNTTLSPPFRKDTALAKETVDVFSERIEGTAREAFVTGVAALTAGEFTKAEQSFKLAISPDTDSTAGLAYLAAVFAASGHDQPAASAWQTALVEGDDIPQIYHWLAGALLRQHALPEARSILEEAAGKWPTEVRFMKPLAMLYATFGRGRQAVRTLERYLELTKDDVEAYYYGVEWLYTVRNSGAVVHSRTEDLRLARAYAEAYSKGGGPQVPLVQQWITYLENDGKR